MAALRHARGFGRVAALALCCLLAADQDAAARRRTRQGRSPRRARRSANSPASRIRPGRFIFADTRIRAGRLERRSTAGPPTITRPPSRHSWRAAAPSSAARRSRATRGRSIRRWSRCAAAPRRRAARRRARRAGSSRRTSVPLRIAKLEEPNGFLTGYYEPIVQGSRVADRRLQGAALPPAARPRAHGAQAQGRELSQHRPRRAPASRAASTCPISTARRSRTARSRRATSRSLSQGPERRVVHPDPGLGARPAHRRHGCCASTTTRTTAIPTRRSAAS